MLLSIKEEEMDAEQDGNMEIKMFGKKTREGYVMTDKKADEGNKAANNILRSKYRMYSKDKLIKVMMQAINEDE